VPRTPNSRKGKEGKYIASETLQGRGSKLNVRCDEGEGRGEGSMIL